MVNKPQNQRQPRHSMTFQEMAEYRHKEALKAMPQVLIIRVKPSAK